MDRPLRLMLLVSLLSLACGARAADNRLYLAAQYDWGAHRGFYVDVENSAPGDGPCRLATMRLILGVGDGKGWRFAEARPRWRTGRAYSVRAVVASGGSTLWLDGRVVGRVQAGFAPRPGPVVAADVPGWASARTTYLLRQTGARVASPDGRFVSGRLPASAAPIQVRLMAGTRRLEMPWHGAPASRLDVRVAFRVDAYPDVKRLAPFVDRYGQAAHAEWPGKVRKDADFGRAADEEAGRLRAWPPPTSRDRFGGSTDAGWRSRATGFYRVERRGAMWWLISPEGNPCFYTGVCSAPGAAWPQTPVTGREFLFAWLPPRSGVMAPAWGRDPWGTGEPTAYASPHAPNLYRRYGDSWVEASGAIASRRLASWAFSGGGKWGAPEGMPCTPVLGRGGVPILGRHPDVFDPAVRATFRESLRKQIEPRRRDPLVVGWSLGNEFDEIVTADETRAIVEGGGAAPARHALIAHAVETIHGGDASKAARAWGVQATDTTALARAASVKPPAADVEAMRRFFADAYYAFIYRTVKSLDPDHLYLGFWIVPGWWENEEDWRLAARHCDVVGYDRYAEGFADASFAQLLGELDKPAFCGEFSYPAWYGGQRGYGLYGVSAEDEADSGRRYAAYVRGAAEDARCVGVLWFQYRDQPLTGRGPGHGEDVVYGEHYSFGVVDVTDRPKWPLVTAMRLANLQAVRWRLDQSRRRERTGTGP
ncbi:MAG: hypothetical protein IT208_18460 [Chthonomonadales bacterium]|nr:hypothetical protein [Chthonomonadales bacterium]